MPDVLSGAAVPLEPLPGLRALPPLHHEMCLLGVSKVVTRDTGSANLLPVCIPLQGNHVRRLIAMIRALKDED